MGSDGREAGGVMLSVTGFNHFYCIRDFTDMRCKHSRVLSVIRERLHREPNDGDVFIVMSRNRRIVCMFSFDNRSYSLFEKKFVAGYQFMKVERNGADTVYRIAQCVYVQILILMRKIGHFPQLFFCGKAICTVCMTPLVIHTLFLSTYFVHHFVQSTV